MQQLRQTPAAIHAKTVKEWLHLGQSAYAYAQRLWPLSPQSQRWLSLMDRDGTPMVTMACLVFFALVALFLSAATGISPSTAGLGAVLWSGCALEVLLVALVLRVNTEPSRHPPAGNHSPHGPDHPGERSDRLPYREPLGQQATVRTDELEKIIEQLRARQLQLEAMANHDCLTGLANRKLLQDRFECAAERAKRSGKCFALLMVDLDGFKAVNDTYGHAAGDTVLITVAQRMVATLRTCDTVARLGGDEFVLIVESIHDPAEIVPIGRKLVHSLLEAIKLDNGSLVKIGASIGLALYPHEGTDLTHMLDVADCAMYECKASGQMNLQPTSQWEA